MTAVLRGSENNAGAETTATAAHAATRAPVGEIRHRTIHRTGVGITGLVLLQNAAGIDVRLLQRVEGKTRTRAMTAAAKVRALAHARPVAELAQLREAWLMRRARGLVGHRGTRGASELGRPQNGSIAYLNAEKVK